MEGIREIEKQEENISKPAKEVVSSILNDISVTDSEIKTTIEYMQFRMHLDWRLNSGVKINTYQSYAVWSSLLHLAQSSLEFNKKSAAEKPPRDVESSFQSNIQNSLNVLATMINGFKEN